MGEDQAFLSVGDICKMMFMYIGDICKMMVFIYVFIIFIYITLCEDHKQVYGVIVYVINKRVGTAFSWFQYITHMNAKKIIDYTHDPKPQALITVNIIQV